MSVGEFFKKHLDSISTSYTNLDTEKADKLVELLSTCTGKIFFTGVGKNGHVAAKATSTFSSMSFTLSTSQQETIKSIPRFFV